MNFVHYDRNILYDIDDDKSLLMLSENLILLGGPIRNSVFNSPVPSPSSNHKTLNDILPVRFLQPPDSGLVIQDSKKFTLLKEQKIGVIQQVDNPWNPKNKIIAIGGPRRVGTEAAVIAFIQSFEIIEKFILKQNYCLIEAVTDDKGQILETRII